MLQFEFNGHTSDEYGLIVTRIEENDTLVNRSLQLGEKNKYRPIENHFGTIYGDNCSFKMGVMRNPCRNKNVVPELKNGILKESELRRSVARLIAIILKSNAYK